MNILERYHAMDYGPAPEARNEADAWLAARHAPESGLTRTADAFLATFPASATNS